MAVELTNAGKMAINTILHQAYEDMLNEKDARIAELEAQLAGPRQVGGYYIVGADEYDAMKSRIAEFDDALTKDVADADHEQLVCDFKVYSLGRYVRVTFLKQATDEPVDIGYCSIICHPKIAIDGASSIELQDPFCVMSCSAIFYKLPPGVFVPEGAVVRVTTNDDWVLMDSGRVMGVTDVKADNRSGRLIYDSHEKPDKSANVKDKRLLCNDGKYDKCGVGGISIDGATKAAELADSMLASGKSLSYAAACLVVLRREMEKIKRANSVLGERNAKLAEGINDLSKLTLTY